MISVHLNYDCVAGGVDGAGGQGRGARARGRADREGHDHCRRDRHRGQAPGANVKEALKLA